jgi:arylsulfatase A-like enzyme
LISVTHRREGLAEHDQDDDSMVAVTADHGEAFGGIREFGLYAHPYQCHIPALTHVPLAKFSAGSAPDRTPETPEEQLEALGYV